MVTPTSRVPSVLLVGVGRFGGEHLKEWDTLAAKGAASIAGLVVASDESRSRLLARTPHPVFTSLVEALQTRPDLVDVCTPTDSHAAVVEATLPHAHVFVEKPVATEARIAMGLYARARSEGRALLVGHIYQHHPVTRALLSEVARRGVPSQMQLTFTNPGASYREGEDPFFEWIHAFDLFHSVAGAPVASLSAWRNGAIAEASLGCDNGLRARLNVGWSGIEPVRRLDLVWPDRRISSDFRDGILSTATRGETHKIFLGASTGALAAELAHALAVCSGRAEPVPAEAHVVAVTALAERAAAAASLPRRGHREANRPRVAVVGGGVFGATCALELAAEYDVTLFERHDGLLTEASYLNQWRHHSGFHYPRSIETILEVQDSRAAFESVYGDVVLRDIDAYYAVSALGREISADRYLATCRACGLDFSVVEPPSDIVDPARISVCLLTDEGVIDVAALAARLLDGLRAAPSIDLRLGASIESGRLDADGRKILNVRTGADTRSERFDFVVNATYAQTNRIARWFGFPVRPMRFDLLEMAVFRIPAARRFMMTILDGPFTSLTSMASGDLFMLSHIHQSILASAVGPGGLPPEWADVRSNRDNLLRHGLRYLPILKDAHYVESRIGVRTVEAFSEDFDGRPTVVTPHGFGCWSVLGGKIITAVSNAREVASHIARELG